jgi:hypothetical protein
VENSSAGETQPRSGSPKCGPPAPGAGGFEHRVGDKRNALRDFFVAQGEQGRLSEAEPFQFFAACGTILDVGFHLALLRVSQLLQVVIP